MDNEVKAIGTALVPVSKPLASDPVPENSSAKIVESLPVEQASLWQYPNLLSGFRNSFLPFETLEKLAVTLNVKVADLFMFDTEA